MLSVFVSESRRIANDSEVWRRKGIAFLDLCGGGRRFAPELQARSEATVDFLVFERERIAIQSEPKETHAPPLSSHFTNTWPQLRSLLVPKLKTPLMFINLFDLFLMLN